MPAERASLDIDDLLKIILVLVVILLAIEIIEGILGLILPGILSPLVGFILLVVLVLWYFDYI